MTGLTKREVQRCQDHAAEPGQRHAARPCHQGPDRHARGGRGDGVAFTEVMASSGLLPAERPS